MLLLFTELLSVGVCYRCVASTSRKGGSGGVELGVEVVPRPCARCTCARMSPLSVSMMNDAASGASFKARSTHQCCNGGLHLLKRGPS